MSEANFIGAVGANPSRCRHGGSVHDAECFPVESVPVPVLEALASAWEDQAGQQRESERNARLKAGDGLRRAGLYHERGEALADCARMLREAIAHGGTG